MGKSSRTSWESNQSSFAQTCSFPPVQASACTFTKLDQYSARTEYINTKNTFTQLKQLRHTDDWRSVLWQLMMILVKISLNQQRKHHSGDELGRCSEATKLPDA